jgi:hypothetical protein
VVHPTLVHHLDETTQWPTAPPDEIASPAHKPVSRAIAVGAGLVVAGALVGTVGVSLVQAATRTPSPAGTQTPASASQGQQGQGQQGQGQQGLPPGTQGGGGTQGGPPPAGGFGGPRGGGGAPGGQRVTGTVASVGSSTLSVQTSAGTSTYAVDGATDIRRNGQTIALAALQVGENVLVRAYPSGSSYVAQRILAGAGSFGRGGPPPNGTTSTTGTAPGRNA